TRFAIPSSDQIHLEMSFLRMLSEDQILELESHVTDEEIKRVVWACGVNKSPAPDGFMFEFSQSLNSQVGDLVSEVQSAFVVNRQILDGSFILNELISLCKRNKSKAMIFKVDFEKAYDSVRWDYLDYVLLKFGFGDRWRGWI
ncbi:RNA-directed DNA polymerase, eukaryota, partial [Tanacetum coccineum]